MQEHFDSATQQLEQLRLAAFPDLFFTDPGDGRPLSLSSADLQGRYIRLSLDAKECLHLSHVEVTVEDLDGLHAVEPKDLRTSSIYGETAHLLEERALFNHEPNRYGFHTTREDEPWAEIDLGQTYDIANIAISNRIGQYQERAWSLRVEVYDAPDSPTLVYDHRERMRQLATMINDTAPFLGHPGHLAPAMTLLAQLYARVVQLDFAGAKQVMADASDIPREERRAVKAALNKLVLPSFRLEWGKHGIRRTFRYWTKKEKVNYLTFANNVVDDLRDLSPHVCLGWGSILGLVREQDFIPHDDDLDVIISFPKSECPTIAEGLARVESHLRARGYGTRGEFQSHRHVLPGGGGKPVDVFVGLEEGDTVSWYPQRRGNLAVADVFPTQRAKLLGVECTIPKNPFTYLEAAYGPGWVTPKPGWGPKWDAAAYEDIL
jgi:hypothetical protein